MTIRWFKGLAALLIGALVIALPAVSAAAHTHPEGTDQSCALCHSVHLPGLLSIAPGLSHCVFVGRVPSAAAIGYCEDSPSVPSNRGPPLADRIS
jgi:hypothetical protein